MLHILFLVKIIKLFKKGIERDYMILVFAGFTMFVCDLSSIIYITERNIH